MEELETNLSQLQIEETSDDNELVLTDEIAEMLVPVFDVVLFSKHIPDYPIDAGVLDGSKKFQVIVTEIHSPYKLWFNVYDEETTPPFYDLSYDMQNFYQSEQGREYQMEMRDIQPNRACAAIFNQVWHRAEIVSDLDTETCTCKVFYLDYGTTARVKITDLRYLKTIYAKEPRYALRGRLARITPPEYESFWTYDINHDATSCILRLVNNRRLEAELFAFEAAERIFHLMLFEPDTKPSARLSINQQLSIIELAVYFPEIEPFPQLDEMLPTFEMLERGIYPTYEHMARADDRVLYYMYVNAHCELLNRPKVRTVIQKKRDDKPSNVKLARKALKFY